MKKEIGLPFGRSVWDTLKLYANVAWYRSVVRLLQLKHSWKTFPFDIRDNLYYWKYLRAWADPAARTWAESPEPPFPFRDYIKPDSIGLDIGAHRGYWTIAHAQEVSFPGAVFLIEPDPENYFFLVRNLQANKLSSHYPLPFGVWSCNTWLSLLGDSSHQGSFTRSISPQQGSTPCVSIDNLVAFLGLKCLDWMKIDVEGAEVEVLRGALSTLQSLQPIVWMEVWKENEAQLTQLLFPIPYTLFQKYDFDENLSYWWLMPQRVFG
ncbi:MAG: FkbM family methyltransferase [Bacteroidia bacterium]|nr:FkbM family methyltransferase [Bacteroidia bacterium]MDW8236243.1 FkbM family methyltransferase [Bacteroidia bacterium]